MVQTETLADIVDGNLRRLGRPDLAANASTLADLERLALELGVPVAELLRPGR